MSRRVYTTTRLGALLLYTGLLACVLSILGAVLSISGLTAGGLALFGAVFVVTFITHPAQ